ncbi:Uncharacterized protein APZ42_020691 [Daphnia magna]|nr:Uncharacterized protein APZ42_020691 [Daphnia magna]
MLGNVAFPQYVVRSGYSVVLGSKHTLIKEKGADCAERAYANPAGNVGIYLVPLLHRFIYSMATVKEEAVKWEDQFIHGRLKPERSSTRRFYLFDHCQL